MLGLLLGRLSESSPRLVAPSGWGGVSRRVRQRRLLRKRGNAWTKCSLLTALILLQGCGAGISEIAAIASASASSAGAYFDYKTSEKAEPVIVTPPTAEYSSEFMMRAALELEYLKRPCAKDEPSDTCSTLGRMILDYGDLRAKIKAAKNESD
tara:strand:- start:151 stop:609 length:459 start_codon:yes stop_codon:yes gene_type:complete